MASLGLIGQIFSTGQCSLANDRLQRSSLSCLYQLTPAELQALKLAKEADVGVLAPTHTTPLPLRATRHQRQVIGLIAEIIR